MRPSHTPGPWEVLPAHPKHRVKWYIHRKTATEDGGYFCAVEALHGTQEAIDIAEANARLIAASPTLLAACHRAIATIKLWYEMSEPSEEPDALNTWELYLQHSPEMKEITAAIRKAEGHP